MYDSIYKKNKKEYMVIFLLVYIYLYISRMIFLLFLHDEKK